jgi:iron complex transport system ATP-binding protein
MGIMLQEYEYNFPATVLDTTLIGRHPFAQPWQWQNHDDQQLAKEALTAVGLADFQQRSVNTLSGGEKRRLNLATLLTQNPDYYLLDEPINHLDIKAQIEILHLLQQRFSSNFSHHNSTDPTSKQHGGIMVIHDPNLAYRFCDHILLLFDQGQWLSGKTSEVLTQYNLSRLYHCPVQLIKHNKYTLFVPTL